jgi:hypothetical protein
MPKPDMTLAVNVNVTGTLTGNSLTATATYSQGASNPPSTGVVDAGGDIDLTKMSDPNNAFSNQTDITFMLSGTITDGQGNSYEVVYPDQVTSAINVLKKNGGPPPAGQFNPSLESETSLLLDDTNSDGQDYSYCLTIEPDIISADPIPTCPLDPNIVNR